MKRLIAAICMAVFTLTVSVPAGAGMHAGQSAPAQEPASMHAMHHGHAAGDSAAESDHGEPRKHQPRKHDNTHAADCCLTTGCASILAVVPPLQHVDVALVAIEQERPHPDFGRDLSRGEPPLRPPRLDA